MNRGIDPETAESADDKAIIKATALIFKERGRIKIGETYQPPKNWKEQISGDVKAPRAEVTELCNLNH